MLEKNFTKVVQEISKTNLIEHYEKTLGAYHFKNQKMIIEMLSAKKLVEKHF